MRKRERLGRRGVEGHEGEEVMTTQEECVEEKREEENNRIMNASHEVPKRYMTWWRGAWWIWINDGSSMHSAKGRRRIWRAAKRAAEQARDEDRVEETQRRTEEVVGEKNGKEGEEKHRKYNATRALCT